MASFHHDTICDGIIGITMLYSRRVRFLNLREFVVRGRKYTVISTESTGKGVYDAVDMIKNDRGDTVTWTRLELLNWIETGKTPLHGRINKAG